MEMVGKKPKCRSGIGIFLKPGPKGRWLACRAQEEGGRGQDQCRLTWCLSLCHPEGRSSWPSALVWGWDNRLGGKSHVITCTELVPRWLQVGFVVEEVRGGSIKK